MKIFKTVYNWFREAIMTYVLNNYIKKNSLELPAKV